MTTQIGDRLRIELRAMVATEPQTPFDGRAVLAAGRDVRARRRLTWLTGGLVAVVAASALALLVRPGLANAPSTAPPVVGPTVHADSPARADELLLPVLQRAGFTVATARPYYVQQGTGYGYWEITRDGTSYSLLLSLFHDQRAMGSDLQRCTGPRQGCSTPRVTLGPNVIASPAWTQTVTDMGMREDPLAGGRVLRRVYRTAHVVEIAVTAAGGRALRDDELPDIVLSGWADTIGDPFPT
jgi:hypothetical protein